MKLLGNNRFSVSGACSRGYSLTFAGRELAALVWAAFWLTILTLGEPDLLDALIALIGRLAA